MKVVAASKGSKTLLLVVIIGLMLTSAVAKGGGGLRGGRAAGTGGLIGGGTATTGGKTSASVTWGPTSIFWLLLTEKNIKENKLLTRRCADAPESNISAVAQGGRGFGVGGIMGGSRAAGGTGGFIGGARATTGGNTSTSVTWVLLLLFGHLL
ncbi:hypothetical protein OIU74_002860 [Salix koriyanagi]|uniref:Glycine-rich protein n=1 Tax=Salix koriyanagi TaxID=2511006 RepID=A0A9Q1APT3_9ROSI|nr:hypothetical protein OIU74_002860 [Salix koriyanagi]